MRLQKMNVFWNVTPCNVAEVYQHLKEF